MTPVIIRAGEKNERMQLKRNVLQLNRGDGTYAEIAQISGVEASAWSWATLFLDVDLDGYEDLLVAAGYDRDSMNGDIDAEIQQRQRQRSLSADQIRHLGLLYPPVPSPIIAFRNLGDLRFREAGREWGFTWAGVNQGISCADQDNDGDLEVIVNNLHEQAGVYRNDSIKPRVAVRLKGCGGNTHGIGSRILLYGGAVPVQSQEVICGGRYLSCAIPCGCLPPVARQMICGSMSAGGAANAAALSTCAPTASTKSMKLPRAVRTPPPSANLETPALKTRAGL